MAPIPRSAFAGRLRRLDSGAFAAFVADVLAHSGWETDVQGALVTARRTGELLRIRVRGSRGIAGRWRGEQVPTDVDAIAVPRVAEAETLGGSEMRVFDADALRDRLLFGVDPADAEHLAAQHLDCRARADDWSAQRRQLTTRVGGGITPVSIAALLLVMLGASLIAIALGPGPLAGVAGGAPVGTDANVGILGAATGGEELPRPTCERGPGDVATTVANTLEPPEKGSAGMHVFWQFTDPEIVENRHYRGFRGYYEGPRYERLRQADEVVLDAVIRDGETAAVYLVAPTDRGTGNYVFELGQVTIDGEECWRIQSVEPT